MKQFDPISKTIGSNEYKIYPFPAFKAANLSGELIKTVAPAISVFTAMFADKTVQDIADTAIQDLDGAAISSAFANLDGSVVERLLKQLLITNRNIVIVNNDYPDGAWLTEEIANETFCMNVQDMYILAYNVIKTNYSGFFGKPISQSGDAAKVSAAATSANTANLTHINFASWN